ncbi:MAG: aminopeptidase P N-terminal domain-containing protein [Chitinophagaceae bacterium]|nr:aminopeptidase P N-terminal domain-containing protein [Chitinophagaceae bacterium]
MRNQLSLSKLTADNRQRFMKKMKPNAVAIFQGTEVLPTNGDAVYTNRPGSDILWLSGIEQEKTMVILYPDNPDASAREVLVLLRPNEHLEKWEGHKLRKEEATAISGIQNIQWADSIDALLQVMMHNADTVYLNTNENDRLDGSLLRTDLLFVQKWMQRFPLHHYERSARLVKELRAIKSKEEIAITQQAVDITEKAFRRVLGFVRPGVWEQEIEAEITHEFIRNRAPRHAYDPIIASGDRARVLHYIDNNQECKDGEVILMDFGASFGNYSADLTRSIPVNGKFTKRQKEVYNAVLNAHQYAKSLLKPGTLFPDYVNKTNAEMEKQILKLGLISKAEIKNQDPQNPAYRRYFYHGITHHLGIDVHDVGTRTQAMKEGMLFTIEPGIYIEEEQIGIRIENNYWLTKSGNTDLFKQIPITADEIEACMKRK